MYAIHRLPDKCCAIDPIPASFLKTASETIAPFLSELFNRSLLSGYVPASFKAAYITPLLKKPDLDSSDAKSYRPISNLSLIPKLLELLIARQLISYLTYHELLPKFQSAYRRGHSTDTAVLRVLSDILKAIDKGDLTALALLDLSAAFDTVDHQILLHRLQTSFGIRDQALMWFQSYLTSRLQHVRLGGSRFPPGPVLSGVPQGSVLGPLLFIMYTADLPTVVESHGLQSHMYADDLQIYGSVKPQMFAQMQSELSSCTSDVSSWMAANRLQLNTAKTEVLWCSTGRRQHLLPTSTTEVGIDFIINDIIIVRPLSGHLLGRRRQHADSCNADSIRLFQHVEATT